jgi:hypothetical protein
MHYLRSLSATGGTITVLWSESRPNKKPARKGNFLTGFLEAINSTELQHAVKSRLRLAGDGSGTMIWFTTRPR